MPDNIDVIEPIVDEAPKKKKGTGVLVAGIVLIVAVVAIILTYNYLTVGSRVPKSVLIDGPINSEVNITVSGGYLQSTIESAAVNLRTSQLGINLKDYQFVLSYDIMDDYFQISNGSMSGTEEVQYYVGTSPIQPSNNIEKEKVIEAINNPKFITEKFHIADDEYALDEYITSLYKEGFLYGRWLHTVDAEEQIAVDIKDNIVFTKDGISDKIINFDGIGTVKLNDLDVFTGKPGILYDAQSGLIYIYDGEDDYTVVYITHNGNVKLNNDPMKLAPVPNMNNIYVDIGWQNISQWGYGTFAVMTEAGMYTFKITENMKDPVDVATKILDWLGIDGSEPVIDIGYDLIYTVDDLMDVYVETENEQ